MERGGGSDVQLADAPGAACSASSGANGAGSPAGRAGLVASGHSGLRRDGSPADNGRDMRGGGAHTGCPDEAEDQDAEHPLLEGAEPSPIRRAYFSLPSLGTRDSVPVRSDDVLMNAATKNQRVALVHMEQGHWGTPPVFFHILADAPDDHVDAVVVEVHGDAKYGNQGEARQAYEVLAHANGLVRYKRPFHDFHTRFYARSLLFLVHKMRSFEVAAKNFGRFLSGSARGRLPIAPCVQGVVGPRRPKLWGGDVPRGAYRSFPCGGTRRRGAVRRSDRGVDLPVLGA